MEFGVFGHTEHRAVGRANHPSRSKTQRAIGLEYWLESTIYAYFFSFEFATDNISTRGRLAHAPNAFLSKGRVINVNDVEYCHS